VSSDHATPEIAISAGVGNPKKLLRRLSHTWCAHRGARLSLPERLCKSQPVDREAMPPAEYGEQANAFADDNR
jgi:hypothetical protein